ncbi:permease, urea carboxylase system [compost metagenome]
MVYGFEACGEVAEEVPNPGRQIPRAMILTVVVGCSSALLSFAGYVLAAPNLVEIVNGNVADPIPAILNDSIGFIGTKIFLVIALTSFLACVMGQQASSSRLVYSFARDNMFPGAHIFAKLSKKGHVPVCALVGVNALSALLLLFVYLVPDSLYRVAGGQMLAGYVAFQMVVVAALRARMKGWKPAGAFSLGRWGWIVNLGALAYGIFACVILSMPSSNESLGLLDRWIALVGLSVVVVTGLLYMYIAQPHRNSTAPEGDAIEVANAMRRSAGVARTGDTSQAGNVDPGTVRGLPAR